mgnify:FL=1
MFADVGNIDYICVRFAFIVSIGGMAKVKYWPEASYLLLNQRVVGNLGSQGNYLGAM